MSSVAYCVCKSQREREFFDKKWRHFFRRNSSKRQKQDEAMTREEQTVSFTIALLQENAHEAQNTDEYEADRDRAVSTCGSQ